MSTSLRLFAAFVFVGLMVLLLGPAVALEAARPGLDKVAHFFAFGLVLWSLGVLLPRIPRVTLAVLAVALGVLTEVIQGLIGRDAELMDAVADSAGIATALLIWAAWRRFRPRRAAGGQPESVPSA